MKDYRAGIYLRLSKEDIQENNSIDAQRDITTKYAIEHNFNVVKEYVDNGYSGILDSRPKLNELMLDIVTNKINMVIIKDLSRLTRDKNKTGYYTEIFFPDNDVRFISVTEMIDSGESYEIDDSIMLRGIVNEYYIADISKKIKSVKTSLKKDGKYVEYNVPYGYKKDSEDKYKVIIDEEVADNVRLIFDMYIDGYSQMQIAKKLTEMGIATAKEYKGFSVKIKAWRQDSVGRILQDPFYTGDMIINKCISNYKTKKTKKVEKSEWIIKENTHEAIISKEKFNRAKKIREEKAHKPKKQYEYLLKGLVHCGHCGARMQYKSIARTMNHGKRLEKYDYTWYYKCRMIYRFPEICNRGHSIKEKDLNEIVLDAVRKRLNKFHIEEDTGKLIDDYKKNDVSYKMLVKLKKEKDKIDNTIKILYNKKLNEEISIDEYKQEYDNMKKQTKILEEKIKELEQKEEGKLAQTNLKQIITDFKNGENFDNEIMKQLIKRIEVFEDKKVQITFNF